jgi:hypothetical protein
MGKALKWRNNCQRLGLTQNRFVSLFQGFVGLMFLLPRALPWADMFGPFGAKKAAAAIR